MRLITEQSPKRISREEYEAKELAAGMPRVLQIMDDDNLTECFEELPEGEIVDEMLAILSDRNRIMQKKEDEYEEVTVSPAADRPTA